MLINNNAISIGTFNSGNTFFQKNSHLEITSSLPKNESIQLTLLFILCYSDFSTFVFVPVCVSEPFESKYARLYSNILVFVSCCYC